MVERHIVAFWIGGAFALLASVASFWQIYLHIKWYSISSFMTLSRIQKPAFSILTDASVRGPFFLLGTHIRS